MISQVRNYFVNRIKAEMPKAKEHTDAYNVDNIGLLKSKEVFFITYSNDANITTDGDLITDSVTVDVTLMIKGYRDVKTEFDNAMDKAHNIKRRASKISNYESGIIYVVGGSISATNPDTNDNIIIVEMSFNVTMNFAVI